MVQRLGDRDSDIRYAAFQEADALPDDALLSFISCVRGSAWGSWAYAEQGQAASWIAFACALICISGLAHIHTVTAVACVLLLVIVVCLMVRQSAPAVQGIDGGHVLMERSLARLLTNRSDARFLAIAISMYVRTSDSETRTYLKHALRVVLETSGPGVGAAVRLHQPFFAKILLRPLRDPKLTYAVLMAFAEAGSSKALAYVRALAFVFEADLRNWERYEQQPSKELEPLEVEDRGPVRVGVRGNVWIRRREGNWASRSSRVPIENTTYVPDLRHLDETGSQVPPPDLAPVDATELRRIIEAARRCEHAMEERLAREEHASILLKPSSRPGNLTDELVRPATFHRESIKELLRPVVR